jgi:DNA-binding response OmpR family regulator
MLPASTRLIAARLRRLIEVSTERDDEPHELSLGPLFMNARHGQAAVGRKPLLLTPHQFELLFTLATRLGQFVQRETIARALRCSAGDDSRSVDVHVHRVRKKLRDIGASALHLDTVHGRGYCLSIDTPEPESEADDDAPEERSPPRLNADHREPVG